MKTSYELLKEQVDELVKTIAERLDAYAVVGDAKSIGSFAKMVKWFWKVHSTEKKGGG